MTGQYDASAGPTAPAPLLRAAGLDVKLRRGRRGDPDAAMAMAMAILCGVSFDLPRGGLTGLVGPNGAGKSTLLRTLAGLLPHRGVLLLDGESLRTLTPARRARRIAYLSQHAEAHWSLTVNDLVALGRLPHRRRSTGPGPGRGPDDDDDDDSAVARALDLTGCLTLAGRRVDTLSGGERARVLLARALAVEAPLLLCDEPVASLDPFHQLRIMTLLRRLGGRGVAVLCVLHDLNLAMRFCDRLLLLDRGRLRADGPPAQVLDAARLARSYRIEAIEGHHHGERYLLPWRTLDDRDSD